jgi:uncharacterized protein YuzE
MTYFKDEDVLHLVISEENESNSVELSPNITAELNENGDLIGIEILEASSFMPLRYLRWVILRFHGTLPRWIETTS